MLVIELTRHSPSAMPLIAEKIKLPPRSLTVVRPRLQRLLADSLMTCFSTIINGRAGSGKTTLATDFAHEIGRPVAWYKVDAPEVDPYLFFHYFVASIQEKRPGFGLAHLQPLLRREEFDEFPRLADAFVYELLKTDHEPLLIVIEDLHITYDTDWVTPFFSRLLPLLPADVHILITSRTMPPAPLWRMRSKQRLCVIEEPELAFTRPEAIELFQSYGLSCEQAMIALDHTHGRVSALQLCAASLAARRRRFIQMSSVD